MSGFLRVCLYMKVSQKPKKSRTSEPLRSVDFVFLFYPKMEPKAGLSDSNGFGKMHCKISEKTFVSTFYFPSGKKIAK